MAAMAGCFPKSPDPISRHRSQYKCSTPPWKEQYRKRCLDRLKNRRQKFVDKCRQDCKTDDSSVVKDVMNEEWIRLSEENTELPPWRPTRESCTPFAGIEVDNSLDEVLSLMDEIQKELMDEERKILARYDENLMFEEASLCAAIESLKTDESVLCPICKRNTLHQNKQVIFCACGMRIDTEYDAVNLIYVRNQIEEALAGHREGHCMAEPEFCVSFVKELGVSNLVSLCKACEFMYIVL
ncbi:hypothetical protein ACROYT_G008649 [Oculina patagonica]